MSGHSKWANIKFRKEIKDSRRGSLFTKLANAITIATREKGSDPETNFKLRLAIQKAKQANLPSDNIQRAIKRGIGEIEGAQLTEINYEAFGPGGIAMLISVTTDNKNRASSEVKNVLSNNSGRMTGKGSVGWMFQKKGIIRVKIINNDSEALELQAIDAGAEDVKINDGEIVIYTQPAELENTRKALQDNNIKISSADITAIPKNTVNIKDQKTALKILKLMDQLDNLTDVSYVAANFDIPEKFINQDQKEAVK